MTMNLSDFSLTVPMLTFFFPNTTQLNRFRAHLKNWKTAFRKCCLVKYKGPTVWTKTGLFVWGEAGGNGSNDKSVCPSFIGWSEFRWQFLINKKLNLLFPHRFVQFWTLIIFWTLSTWRGRLRCRGRLGWETIKQILRKNRKMQSISASRKKIISELCMLRQLSVLSFLGFVF